MHEILFRGKPKSIKSTEGKFTYHKKCSGILPCAISYLF